MHYCWDIKHDLKPDSRPIAKLERVETWKLHDEALKSVRESVTCMDLTPLVQSAPDEVMDMIIGDVYHSAGSIFVVERIGAAVISQSAIDMMEKMIKDESLAWVAQKKWFRWPLG